MNSQKTLLKEKEANLLCKSVSLIVDHLNSSIFSNHLGLNICFSFEKNLSVRFDSNSLIFGSNIFSLYNEGLILCIFHEMIHAINFKKGKKDLGRNSYHNKEFLKESLSRGAFVIKHKNHGFSILSLEAPRNVVDNNCVFSPQYSSFSTFNESVSSILTNFNWVDFYQKRSNFFKKENSFKYTCSCPPPFNSIRSGRGPNSLNPLNAMCKSCGCLFVCRDCENG